MGQIGAWQANSGLRSRIQTIARSLLEIAYPPRCIGCGELVESDFGLCGICWRDTPFIGGATCNRCGAPVPGESHDFQIDCDDCLKTPRPWVEGRSVLIYKGRAKQLILALKHGDRPEIAHAAGRWMQNAAAPLLRDDTLIGPVPLHWSRLWHRQYNQSALLARALERRVGCEMIPDLLQRPRRTKVHEGMTAQDREQNVKNAIRVNPRWESHIRGRSILLIDDVMTSGATLAETTRACERAGAGDVFVLALARAVRDA